ncbi:hypothetical protein HK104_002936, partial [Borealophlyctis nickersoniae]
MPSFRLPYFIRARLPHVEPEHVPYIVGAVTAALLSGLLLAYWRTDPNHQQQRLQRRSKRRIVADQSGQDAEENVGEEGDEGEDDESEEAPVETDSPARQYSSYIPSILLSRTPEKPSDPATPKRLPIRVDLSDPTRGLPLHADAVVHLVEHLLVLHSPSSPTSSESHGGAGEAVRSVVGKVAGMLTPHSPDKAVAGADGGLGDDLHPSGPPLPLFVAQRDSIIRQIKKAQRPRVPLLVEGPPGIGKRGALTHYTFNESRHRPAIYLNLSAALHRHHGGSSVEEDGDVLEDTAEADDDSEDEEEIEEDNETEQTDDRVQKHGRYRAYRWRRGLEEAFGWKYDGDFPMSESFQPLDSFTHITQSLRLIASASRHGPTLIVIDDVQLLFKDHRPSDVYVDVPELFGWLHERAVEGSLQVVLCSSRKSTVAAVRRRYDWTCTTRFLNPVSDATVIQYILKDVNPCLPEHRRFTHETAALFVDYFGGNLKELERFVSGRWSAVQDFIDHRTHALLHRLRRHLPLPTSQTQSARSSLGHPVGLSTPGEFLLRDVILDMIMRNGMLDTMHMEARQLGVVEDLVERNVLKWRRGE